MVGREGHSGGARENAGRPAYRKASPWPEGFDLKTRENWADFIKYFIRAFWELNPLDARAGGCINNALRLLGDAEGWITKAPLQITQAQIAPAPGMISEKEVQELLEALPLDQQLAVWKRFKERRGLKSRIPSDGKS